MYNLFKEIFDLKDGVVVDIDKWEELYKILNNIDMNEMCDASDLYKVFSDINEEFFPKKLNGSSIEILDPVLKYGIYSILGIDPDNDINCKL